MSDDLGKRLRQSWGADRSIMSQTERWMAEREAAADRIEELEAANRGLVRLNEATEARAKTAEAKLETAVEALTQIEHAYYQEATNPSPETVRRMAARMNGIARDTQNTLAELKGEK